MSKLYLGVLLTCSPLLPGAEAAVVGELQELYYNNRDVRLMLELLATSSGLAPAIAVLTIFDKVRGYRLVNSENMKYADFLILDIPRSFDAPHNQNCQKREGCG